MPIMEERGRRERLLETAEGRMALQDVEGIETQERDRYRKMERLGKEKMIA